MSFAVASLVAVPITLGLGWDEIVYVSQWGTHAPPATLTAPRARGIILLTGPVASWTDSTVVLRLYLTATAAAALGVAYWPWARVLPRPIIAPLAAALYASLWISVFYANEAMPNHYMAMGAVAATGCCLLGAARPGSRVPRWGLGAAVAATALVRPSDAAWLGLALLAAVVAVPALRRWRLAIAVVGGLVAGGLPWVIEAELRYGGLSQRLEDSSEAQGGTGLTFSLHHIVATLDGPLLCRPCTDSVKWPAVLWWLALAVLVPVGIWAARRAGAGWQAWLPVVVGAAMSFTYVFLIGYSAPRFLLATYGLLAVPTAWGLLALVTLRAGAWRRVMVAAVAVGVAGHLFIQGAYLRGNVGGQLASRGAWAAVAQTMNANGVRPPCALTGTAAVPVAYYARCRATAYRRTATPAQVRQAARGVPIGLALQGESPPAWASDWRRVPVPGQGPSGWTVYLPPR